MCQHKPACLVTLLLVVIGGLNWGLVGLGSLLGKNLNLVNLLVGSWPVVESIVYLLVGVAAVIMAVGAFKCSDKCPCNQQ